MSGALTVLAGVSGNSAINWADIVGSLDAVNADQTMPYATTITASVSITSGWGQLYYVLNGGAVTQYTGPFAVALGDTLHWEAQTKGTMAATVVVYRTGPTLLDTFNITLS